MKRYARTLFICALIASGCTTPAPVREGAKLTSDSLGIVQRELDRFSNESARQSKIKAERILTLEREDRGLRDELTDLTALYGTIGGVEGQWVQVYEGLTAATDGFAKADAESAAANTALAKSLQAAYTDLPAPPAAIRDAAVRYAQLAQPDSLGTQFSFLKQYGRCTAYGIELARAQAAGKTGDSLPKKPDSCASFSQ